MARFLLLLSLLSVLILGCDDDDNGIELSTFDVPESYTFSRNGSSTVNFEGQSTRIAMATELAAAMTDPNNTAEGLAAMFANEGPDGEDVDPFTTDSLNASTKSVRGKVAASHDYFFANTTEQASIRGDFDSWLSAQATEVFPNWNKLATPGQAGQIADGSRTRYVNGRGLEYNQLYAKSLLGALMLDQAVNNYLSPAVLDEAANRADNDGGTTEQGQNYTTMEHKWDEAYGYVFGAAKDPSDPLATLGQDDKFLNEYIAKVDEDADFSGIARTIFDAFKTGRAAIVAGDYAERDRQATTIRTKLSKVLAVRGTFYLARGSQIIEDGNNGRPSAFHALSEAYGFVYSLQFTRNPGTGAPYFDRAEITALLAQLAPEEGNGLWGVSAENVRTVGNRISQRFDFSFTDAAN